ncbi:MAG: monovalent cation/H+ antiporter subunit D family protein [Gammaproteobacteria bacterium TMED1]|nr:MAG: monovalent cation/H+ antiporter subunit D family protein [Gammaproteobacteria bacterium TMED1]
MVEHIAILQVVIPLVLAPLCLVIPRYAWLIAFFGSLAALCCAIVILLAVLGVGDIFYVLGGWAPPWGISLHIDPLGGYILLLVTLVATLVVVWAHDSVSSEIQEDQINLFWCMFLLCLTGSLGIVATGDAFNVFVFLEIASLSTYSLIALGRDRRALMASFQYLVMGTVGATFILISIGLLYMMTGTLNMVDLASSLPELRDTTTVQAAFAFLTVGVSLKIALFPLHQWLPNAYTYAPSTVTVFLAATSTKISLYVLLRFFYTVFGSGYAFDDLNVDYILLPLSILAIFVSSMIAVFQKDLKKILAYSSVAQIGYMTLGVALANSQGLTAAIVHMFNHGLIKGGLFLAVGGLCFRIGSTSLSDLRGAGRTMPWTMGAIVLGGCALIGVPLTAGFVSKWYLIVAALEKDMWYVALAILAASIIAATYVWRIVETLYFQEGDSAGREVPVYMLLPTWLLIAMLVWLGIDTDLTIGIAERAAQSLVSP